MNRLLRDILEEVNNGKEITVLEDTFYDAFNELPEEARGNQIAVTLQEMALGRTIKQEAQRWLAAFNIQMVSDFENPYILHMRKTPIGL